MRRGPSRIAEAIVAFFVPPACREEVVGDLHERYRSPFRYTWDALCTVPQVIGSRVRRTADPQVLLMQALALYLSFLLAAWLTDRATLDSSFGLLRLLVPPGMVLFTMMLEDAYARPGKRSPWQLARGPVLGVGLALGSQGLLHLGSPGLTITPWMIVCGGAMSLLLSCSIRLLFPPVIDQLHGVNAPALWLNRDMAPIEVPAIVILALKYAAVAAVVVLAAWIAAHHS